jgi:hypothetical protein
VSAALAVTVLVAAAGMPGNEYSTAAFGRWHLTRWQQGPARSFGRWPNGRGFDYFYGFLGEGWGLTRRVVVIRGLVRLFIAAASLVLIMIGENHYGSLKAHLRVTLPAQ